MKRKRSPFFLVWNIFTTILVIAIVLIAVALVGVRVVGYTPYSIQSGSMEPAYHVGSVIYVKDVEPSSVKVGDPITFILDDKPTIATHRVVSIDSANETFITKGDANKENDATPTSFSSLMGVPVFTIPYLGYLATYISTSTGRIVATVIVLVVFISTFIKDPITKVETEYSADDVNNVV